MNFWNVLLLELLEADGTSQLKQRLDKLMEKQFHKQLLTEAIPDTLDRRTADAGRV